MKLPKKVWSYLVSLEGPTPFIWSLSSSLFLPFFPWDSHFSLTLSNYRENHPHQHQFSSEIHTNIPCFRCSLTYEFEWWHCMWRSSTQKWRKLTLPSRWKTLRRVDLRLDEIEVLQTQFNLHLISCTTSVSSISNFGMKFLGINPKCPLCVHAQKSGDLLGHFSNELETESTPIAKSQLWVTLNLHRAGEPWRTREIWDWSFLIRVLQECECESWNLKVWGKEGNFGLLKNSLKITVHPCFWK